jgi:hypothetical protein
MAAMALLGGQAVAAELFVSPAGSDSNPGTKNNPLQTPVGARDMVRASGKLGKEPVTVSFLPGTYYMTESLGFGPEDSGTEKAPVVYRSLEEGKAVFSGGVKLKLEWQSYRDGILKAEAPAGLQMDQLFINGERQPMARYPNYDPKVRVFNGYAADAFSKERAARWKNPAGGYMHAIHRAHWGGFHFRITGKDEQGELTYEGGWQNNRQNKNHRDMRMVENIFEELDAPGEWFHDADAGVLYVCPPEGVDLKQAEVVTVQLAHLVDFDGSKETPAAWLSLEGITFRHTARTFMKTKEPLLRSDWTIYRGGAVTFTGASDCSIRDCTFDSPGGNAVFVNKWNRKITVKGSHFREVGASAVAFVGSPDAVRNPKFEYGQRNKYSELDLTPGPKNDNYPAECLVEDCLMARTGRIEKQGAGVQISMSHKITVRQCSIYDTSRAGINISEGAFGGHIIEYCDVFDTVKETGDHGSFNSWGRDRFWHLIGAPEDKLAELSKLDILDPNIIRNSRWRCDHGWDVDLDDGSSNYEIYNNLFLRGGLKLREGFHRKVYNNIGVNSTMHAHCWYPNSMDVVTGNIWMSAYASPARMCKGAWGKYVDRNLFVNENQRTMFALKNWDINSISGDPMFIDPEQGDFRVKDGSPAIKMGFKNFPMDKFGVQKSDLKAIARSPVIPKLNFDVKQNIQYGKRTANAWKAEVWMGALIRGLEDNDYSAFGVSKEDGGIHLIKVRENSKLAKVGFESGDLLQKINGKPVKTVAALEQLTKSFTGKPMAVTFVRDQQEMLLTLP